MHSIARFDGHRASEIQSLAQRARPVPNYIPSIDGLRCLAVSLVLCFHFGVGGVSGGFIGVDVFFVISGYLVSRILLSSGLSRPELVSFFFGRWRRIFPAYIVMIITVAVAACLFLFPDDLLKFSPLLMSTPLFLSNFVLRVTSGYFNQQQEWDPLLHTWSLAAEWQFYLILPLALVVVRRLKIPPVLPMAVAAVASFIWSVMGVRGWHASPTAAFYLLPSRVWEFMVGALISLPQRPPIARRWLAELLSSSGLALIAACAIFYNSRTAFPGAAALAPCLGAGAILASSSVPTLVNSVLTWRPIRLVGQASYSIYLWHWPVVVFFRYCILPPESHLGVSATAILSAVSLVLGFVSWRFVERPFRRGPKSASSNGLDRPVKVSAPSVAARWIAASLIAGMIPAAVAWSAEQGEGWTGRFSPVVMAALATHDDVGAFRHCAFEGELCRLGNPTSPADLLVIGDSHAAALADGIDEAVRQRAEGGYLLSAHGCPPFLHGETSWPPGRALCQHMQANIPKAVAELKPEKVVMHGVWASYAENGAAEFAADLAETLSYLRDRHIRTILLSDVPGAPLDLPRAYARQIAFGVPVGMISRQDYVDKMREADSIIRSVSKKFGAEFVDVGLPLCDDKGCAISGDERPLYFDKHHLSGFGSRYLVRNSPALETIWKTKTNLASQ